MAKPVDIGSKRLISLAPNAWVQWVTGNSQVRASQLLDAEFQWISRESDVIVKAKSPEHSEFLILNELQLRYDQNMPQRMRNYVALAEEKYNLSAYPVLINILPPPATVTIVDCYDREFMGLKARQDYRVINLWEVEAELVLEQPLPPLFPFVPILFGGGSESKLRSAVQALRADQTLNQL
ncbi:MAG: Rpn family recombination-promoting nuclease/putative transposase, partial [Moorea sp. SIO4A3]|nr:Rpn family recombination-promoting nuclease/putative transposase [Moorena sp. SIO4A3]